MTSDPPSATTLPIPRSTLRLRPGDTFADRYVVEAVLGEGGMGAVYAVLDGELDEVVALKLLRPEWASAQGALDRFRREVKLARRVTHPNVARTFDLGAWDGIRFLTMERIEGEPLSRRLQRGDCEGKPRGLPLAEALRVATEIARGLAAAHAAGVVHRDLKPDNVMIAEARVVITDFGIARLAEGAGVDHATRTLGSAIGTPAYMAPEQVEGRELDGRADIYALGVVLYEMLTGELPFAGDTVYALAAARLTAKAPDPRERACGIPEAVALLVRDALARRREERPDAQELLRRIDEIRGVRVERGDVVARPPSSLGPAASITPTSSWTRAAGAIPTPAGPRTIAVVPSRREARQASATEDLVHAIGDALAALRGVRVLAPSVVRAGLAGTDDEDPGALGRALGADLLVESSARTASGRTRVRVRLVDVGSGNVLWNDRWEGEADEPFAVEDDVVRGVTEAIRLRLSDEWGRRGPADPDARSAYQRARERYVRFGTAPVGEAIEILRSARAAWPDDPWILSALGAALTRQWVLLAGSNEVVSIAEAEEVSLRALAIDASIGETYSTIGILRLQQGETRAAVRAFQEAIARSPLHAESYEYLGRLLCESGHPDEGMRRLDLAVRLDPNSVAAHWERARTFALLGDRERAEQALGRSLAVAGATVAHVFQRARLSLWWRDASLAQQVLDALDGVELPIGPVRELMLPIVAAMAEGRPLAPFVEAFRAMAWMGATSPRQRAFFRQLAVEFLCGAEAWPQALETLSQAIELPLVDLLWMDRCPLLAPLREDPAFARARAVVAARAAEALS